VAWSISPPEIARRCSVAKQTADISSPLWTQGIAAEYLASGRLTAHLGRVREAYGRKCRALCDALRASMGDAVSFHEPDGGMFVWAKLTLGVRSGDLLKAAIARKVMFVPGMGFYADDPDASTLRLCFAAPPVSAIQEGVGRLAGAWEAMSGHAGVAHA
jgi:DNA-binding transcriptional MocR family regulator